MTWSPENWKYLGDHDIKAIIVTWLTVKCLLSINNNFTAVAKDYYGVILNRKKARAFKSHPYSLNHYVYIYKEAK